MKLHAAKFAGAGAITVSICMFLLSILFAFGMYQGAVMRMQEKHLFYAPTMMGTLTGILEAAVVAYFFFYIFAWIYNGMVSNK